MRELTYFVATSVDGYIAGPGGDVSPFPTAGDHIDWIVEEYPETLPGPALAAVGLTPARRRFDTVLMGWATYDLGLQYGLDDPYPHLDQYVFSNSRKRVEGSVTLSDDPVTTVARLKGRPGSGIWLCGGGQLARALSDEIDHVVVKVNPIALGDGVPLFAAGPPSPPPLTLTDTRRFASGVVVTSYSRGANR